MCKKGVGGDILTVVMNTLYVVLSDYRRAPRRDSMIDGISKVDRTTIYRPLGGKRGERAGIPAR